MHLQQQLQSAINQATAWTNGRGYSISIEKTAAIHVHRTLSDAESNLRLFGNMIPFTDKVKFLRMYFDKKNESGMCTYSNQKSNALKGSLHYVF